MGLGIICSVVKANAEEYKEHLNKEFVVKDGTNNTLFIYNISGFIKVEGYSGNKVILDMDETISGDNKDIVDAGRKEFKLGFEQKSDSIIAYIAEPYDTRPHRNRHYNSDRDVEYDSNVDFTVKVPYGTNLNISTVTDGQITVNNVTGNLHINNVNGAISVTNAKGVTFAHTVNGDVSVTYASNPSGESSYYTISGNINVSYKPDLSADLQFKSMNGEFFTDFPDAQLLPASVSKTQEKKSGGLVYKLHSTMAVRFGKGGRVFKFETLNGNVYIKKS